MKILNHRVHSTEAAEIPYIRSPNVGGTLDPKYLVMHYTAGQTAEGAVSWLTNKISKASAHLVVGRDGEVTQLVRFNRIAMHCGPSHWDGLTGMSRYSIGIELDNAGRLKRSGGKWLAWFGKEYEDDDVLQFAHKYDTKLFGWHTYTKKQINAALEIGSTLFEKYDLLDVVGHDDISPKRKWDPGPAFPMHSFRSRIVGREEDEAPKYEAMRTLNVREGPGYLHSRIIGVPIPKGTIMEVVDTHGNWSFVDVLDEVDGDMDIEGWVFSRYIRRIES
jgi:N-acetylmuramoyl-L-alanine amidase